MTKSYRPEMKNWGWILLFGMALIRNNSSSSTGENAKRKPNAIDKIVRIFENAPNGTLVYQLLSSKENEDGVDDKDDDDDDDDDGNAAVPMQAGLSGNGASRFKMSSDSVFVNEFPYLSGKVGDEYLITLTASLSPANPGIARRLHLLIVVSKRNSFAPSFVEAGHASAEVYRYTETFDEPVVAMIATDEDIEEYNRAIVFSMIPRTGYFDIDDETGVITTKPGLHRAPSIVRTEVIATNNASPPLATGKHVTIFVRDISEPRNVTVDIDNSTTVSICWVRPKFGRVTKYEVSAIALDGEGVLIQKRPQRKLKTDWIEAGGRLEGERLCQSLTDLTPSTAYEAIVRAWADSKLGIPAKVYFKNFAVEACNGRQLCTNGGKCVQAPSEQGFECLCKDGRTRTNCFRAMCQKKDDRDCEASNMEKSTCDCFKKRHQSATCRQKCRLKTFLQQDQSSSPTPCLNGGTRTTTSTGKTICECPEHFRGSQCEDRDSCSVTKCQNGAVCQQSPIDGATRCDCLNGFYGEMCEYVDRCEFRPCRNGGYCRNLAPDSDYHCSCYDGFYGRNCTRFDPCSSSPCQNNGHCRNLTETDYTCRCQPGFYGDNCDLYSPCVDTPCLFDGMCNSIDGRYVCECEAGRFGRRCEKADPCRLHKPCAPNTVACHNLTDTSYRCICEPGWSGDTCSVFNSCFTKPCSNGGTCVATPSYGWNSFRCDCPDGFWGDGCELINPCRSNPCANSGKCVNVSATAYRCVCSSWHFGEHCEETNACSSSNCHNGAACLNTSVSDYKCVCPPQNFGDSCQFTNSCYINPCGRGKCRLDTLSNGSKYTCTCPPSYYGTNCQFYDPCARNPCQNNGRCTALSDETFECACKNFYFGPYCQNFDVCRSQPCQRGGSCVNVPTADFRCVCPSGKFGRTCESHDPCFDRPCRNGATCQYHAQLTSQMPQPQQLQPVVTYRCHCAAGYYGTNCDSINPCHQNPCLHGGTCLHVGSGKFSCRCDIEFQGDTCENETPCNVHGKRCYNDGACKKDAAAGKNICVCPDGYFGFRCQNFNPCSTPGTCINGGTCQVMDNGMYHCACNPGFFGEHCELHRPCNIYVCKNNGTCVHTLSADICYCRPGFAGKTCERDLNECESEPCQNGGTCVDFPGRYTCACPEGFAGDSCHRIDMCPKETMLRAKGIFLWPSTAHSSQAVVECPRNPGNFATRHCLLLDDQRAAAWSDADISSCSLMVHSPEEALEALRPYVSYSLTDADTVAEVVNLLEIVLKTACEDSEVGTHTFDVIDRVLEAPVDVVQESNSTDRLLDIIERFLSNVKWLKDNITLVKSNVEVEVRHITWIDHESGTYYEPHFAPGVQLFLPPEVFQRDVASDRVKFVYLKNGKLFRNNPNQLPQSVGEVLSASVGPDSDFDLKACVKYTMPNKQFSKNNRCVFWNSIEKLWSPDGIDTLSYRGNIVTCCSNHLTYFGVSSDPSIAAVTLVQEDVDMTIMSHSCLGIAILSLLVVFFTYATVRSFNKEEFGQIVLQLTTSMLAMDVSLLFVYNRFKMDIPILCLTVSILSYFFTLSTHFWLCNLAHFIARQLTARHPSQSNIGKRTVVAWGLPLVPVTASSIFDIKGYHQSSYSCLAGGGESNRLVFYATFVLPVSLSLVATTALSLLSCWLASSCGQKSRHGKAPSFGSSLVVGTLVLVVLSSVSWSLYCLSTYQSFTEHVVPLQYCHCVMQAFVGLALLCFYLLFRPEVRTFCIRCCASGLSCAEESDGITSRQRRSDSTDYKHARQRRGSAKGHRCFQADTSEIPPASASTEVPAALSSRAKIARSTPQYKAVSSSGPRTEEVRPSNKHSSNASSSGSSVEPNGNGFKSNDNKSLKHTSV